MAKKIRVILLEDVESCGRAGDIVAVAEGYARNFLFAQGRAALADAAAITRNQLVKQREATARAVLAAQLQERAEQLEGTELTIVAKVKEGEEIFGSVTAKRIAEELQRQAHLLVKPKDVALTAALTRLGSTDVTVALSPDIETHIRVTIVADPTSRVKEEE